MYYGRLEATKDITVQREIESAIATVDRARFTIYDDSRASAMYEVALSALHNAADSLRIAQRELQNRTGVTD